MQTNKAEKNPKLCSIFGSDYLSFAYQRTSASLNNFIICIIFTFLSTDDNDANDGDDEAACLAGWEVQGYKVPSANYGGSLLLVTQADLTNL